MGNRCNYKEPRFELCENLANLVLYSSELTCTTIETKNLTVGEDIVFDSMQEFIRLTGADLERFMHNDGYLKDACTLKYGNIYIILYNENADKRRLNWSIAHELGHVLLGHDTNPKCDKKYCKNKNICNIEEVEAHWFAAQLLMPEYIIFIMREMLKDLDEKDIYFLFNVSEDAALKRIKNTSSKTIRCTSIDKTIFNRLKNNLECYFYNREFLRGDVV